MATLTPANLRAARAILKWTMRDLERESGVALTTIYAIENDRRASAAKPETVAAIVSTFTSHGVEILDPPADGARRLPGA